MFILPKGFNDYHGTQVHKIYKTINKVIDRGSLFGCEPLLLSPMQYLELARVGRDISTEKMYSLKDKSQRDLVLTPDSTPAVLRWISEQTEPMQRVCFICPIFRYRKQRRRFFHQIGFAFSGEPVSTRYPEIDPSSALLANQAARLFGTDFQIPLRLQVTDFRMWHNFLSDQGLSYQSTRDWLHRMRPLSNEARMEFIDGCGWSRESSFLAKTLSTNDEVVFDFQDPSIQKYLMPSYIFANQAVSGTDIKYGLFPGDFHSSELQEEMAFSFVDENGRRRADGGDYSRYAGKFNAQVKSFYSFAAGVESLSESSRQVEVSKPKIVILVFGENRTEATAIVDELNSIGVTAYSRQASKNLAADFRREFQKSYWVIPYGSKEKESNRFNLNCGEGKIYEHTTESLIQWVKQSK